MTTEHSRNLRIKTSAEWLKRQRKAGLRGELTMSGKADLVAKLKVELSKLDIPGSNLTKCLELVEFYKRNKQ